MTVLLPSPVLQFCDAIGAPYAAGTIETYVTGTTTPKATWNDPAGGAGHLNTNPIVLDSAGRCILYGDGGTRLVLRDSAGNLIWDQPSTTLVSAAMLPVVQAATIADAVALLGIQGLIDASVAAEAALRAAADTTLQTNINTQATNLANAETTINAAIAAETAARIAADTHLQSEIDTINATLGGAGAAPGTTRGGSVTADAFSFYSIVFAEPFPTVCVGIWIQPPAPVNNKLTDLVVVYTTLTLAGSTGQFQDAAGVPAAAATPMNYIAFGF